MVAVDSENHRVFPLLELPGSGEMWAHCGQSARGGQFPACRSATWSIEAAERLDGTPTEPTYDDADVLAVELPGPMKKYAWRWKAVSPGSGDLP